jgi:ribA/ribD-fused uncharacterized protein
MRRVNNSWQPTVTDQGIYGFFGEYRWLSNFHLSPVLYEGILYPSVEHAYQAAKTLDLEVRELFLQLSVGQAKRFGQEIELRPDWDDKLRLHVMYDCLRVKFTSDLELQSKLLATGDLYLEETNYWGDVFYGVKDGVGKNYLGKLLMAIRRRLQFELVILQV